MFMEEIIKEEQKFSQNYWVYKISYVFELNRSIIFSFTHFRISASNGVGLWRSVARYYLGWFSNSFSDSETRNRNQPIGRPIIESI